jgi:D-alanyl-D-alanine dipeptidase
VLAASACTIEDRTPGRTPREGPVAPAFINAADDILAGTPGDADTLLVDVRALDSTIRVDLRYRDTANFTGAALPGYEGNRALLHRDAAAALARVQAGLRAQGLGLLVYDAYRPVRATVAMVEWAERVGRSDLVTDGYIADRSRHNLGVAIDCTLVDLATGVPLDMGTPYDTFDSTAHTANARGAVAERRLRLVTAMAREGFVNYDREWWHYSYDVSPVLRFDVPVR